MWWLLNCRTKAKAVSAYFTSKQILPFTFHQRTSLRYLIYPLSANSQSLSVYYDYTNIILIWLAVYTAFHANTRCWCDVVLMLVHRLRRWPNSKSAFDQRLTNAVLFKHSINRLTGMFSWLDGMYIVYIDNIHISLHWEPQLFRARFLVQVTIYRMLRMVEMTISNNPKHTRYCNLYENASPDSFRHLKLEIALAIPAINKWKIEEPQQHVS